MNSISDFFIDDHRRLDALLEQFQLPTNDLTTKTDIFSQFKQGLLEHIDWEEKHLFPTLEVAAGWPGNAGPTFVMRTEHELIKQHLNYIEQGLSAGQTDIKLQGLLDILQEHNDKEETILYPKSDQILSPQDKSQILDAIRELV